MSIFNISKKFLFFLGLSGIIIGYAGQSSLSAAVISDLPFSNFSPSRQLFEKSLGEIKKQVYIQKLPEIQDQYNVKKPTIFISYAWEADIKPWVDQILSKDLGRLGFEVLYDQKGILAGSLIPSFEEKVGYSTYVVALCTPNYLKRYSEHNSLNSTGVGREVKKIMDRLQFQAYKNTVFPLYLKGNFNSCVPPVFSAIAAFDISIERTYFGSFFLLSQALFMFKSNYEEPINGIKEEFFRNINSSSSALLNQNLLLSQREDLVDKIQRGDYPPSFASLLTNVPNKINAKKILIKILKGKEKNLVFSMTNIGTNYESLQLFLLCLSYNSRINQLSLRGSEAGTEGIRAITQNTTLTSLDLWGNNLGGNEGTKIIAQSKTITKLKLGPSHINDEGASVLSQNTILKSLEVRYNDIGVKGAKAFAQNRTLTSLELGNNKLGIEGAKAFIHTHTLKHLDIMYNQLGDEGASAIAQNKTLDSLGVAANNIGDIGAIALAKNKNLTSLELANNQIGDQGVISLALSRNLTYLDLRLNKIGDIGCRALAQNSSITWLKLADNKIGTEGVKALAQNPTLTALELEQNKLKLEAFKELAKHKNITALNLWSTNMGPEAAIVLAQNKNLTSLRLENNPIGEVGIRAFQNSINPYLRPSIKSYLQI